MYTKHLINFCVNRFSLLILLTFTFVSCEKILEVDEPSFRVAKKTLFEDDVTTTTAVTGMYASMLQQRSFASGSFQSITSLSALSSDDAKAIVNNANKYAVHFEENNIPINNPYILELWRTCYENIYQANSIIEGLSASTTVSKGVKDHSLGEAYFVRAFAHFYLSNMFGDVPLVISTDYKENTQLAKTNKANLYSQIVKDLLQAQFLMSDNYPSPERVRPNKSAATALLARVYLYNEDWTNAEIQSSKLINNNSYQIDSDLNNTFLSTSTEAIWQLRQTFSNNNTWEGSFFIIEDIPRYTYLTQDLINSFENGDARMVNWIGKRGTYYYPMKYKIRTGGVGNTPPVALTEYSMVFRLGEQYLIRAEARAKLNKLGDAILDLDVIRNRAQLPLLQNSNPSITKESFLLAVEHERRCEFFSEWGHRWFDLKRTNRAASVLPAKKPGWTLNDLLYPIPEFELNRNPNFGGQNSGY